MKSVTINRMPGSYTFGIKNNRLQGLPTPFGVTGTMPDRMPYSAKKLRKSLRLASRSRSGRHFAQSSFQQGGFSQRGGGGSLLAPARGAPSQSFFYHSRDRALIFRRTLHMQRSALQSTLMLGALFTLLCAATGAPAQEVDGDVLTREWMLASNEQRVAAIESALRGASDKRKATALNAISLLVAENGDAARKQFTPGSIRPYMLSRNEDVSRIATRAYFAVSDSEAKAETDLVAMISRGELPLPSINYIRYLRQGGVASDAASRWLTSLAVGPISAEKYAAVHALIINSLVGGSDIPPGSMLPHVMALIRSPEYFCDYTLVRSLEKFGRPAVQYLDELVALRARLESEAGLPVDDRSFVLRTEYEIAASAMDEAIARLQR